jgi:1-phosphofructokinase family hexose kinase
MSAPELICIVPNPSIDKTAEVARLKPGTIHRPDLVVAVPGGKGLNVARAAAALGVPTEAVLLLGGDAGRWMVRELERRGIRRSVTWVRGETRTCLSILDRASGRMTEVYEPGPTIGPADWRRFVASAARTVAGAPAGSVAAISGSFPRGAPEDAAATLVQALASTGVEILLDTSGPHLSTGLAMRPAVVKINAAEASLALGTSVDTEAQAVLAAEALVERGAKRAIVTRGAAGAVAADDRRSWVVEPIADGGPFIVGSGDAFLAGLAAGLLAHASFDRCLRLATGAGAANTKVAGAGELAAEEASRLAAAVRIRPHP